MNKQLLSFGNDDDEEGNDDGHTAVVIKKGSHYSFNYRNLAHKNNYFVFSYSFNSF
jgi:hypothetical protein